MLRNKILMRIVSVLLVLVLVSSCILSGLYAKYVTAKDRYATVKLEKFGAIVTMTVDQAKLQRVLGGDCAENLTAPTAEEKAAGKVWLGVSTDNQIKSGVNTVTIHNLALKPGDYFTGKKDDDAINDLVQFTVGGIANVDCRVIVDADFIYDPAEFVYDTVKDTRYMPFEFTWRLNDGGTSDTFKSVKSINLSNDASGEISYMYALELAWLNSFKGDMSYAENGFIHKDTGRAVIDYCVYQDFSAGSDIKLTRSGVDIEKVNFGLSWPFSSTDKYDKADTIISENPDAKLALSFTVSVEQIQIPKETT